METIDIGIQCDLGDGAPTAQVDSPACLDLRPQGPTIVDPGDTLVSGQVRESAQYTWQQDAEDVEITSPHVDVQPRDKKMVNVTLTRQRLRVVAKNEVLVDTTLFAPIRPAEATWTLSGGALQVTLVKEKHRHWPSLTSQEDMDFEDFDIDYDEDDDDSDLEGD